jgi:carbamoyltransferase
MSLLPSQSSDTCVVGLSGGSLPTRALPRARSDHRLPTGPGTFHDSAAALIRGGRVVAAIEEERLNRLKHTNRLAVLALAGCLRTAHLSVGDIHRFAYYGKEDGLDRTIFSYMLGCPHIPPRWTVRAYLAEALSEDLRCAIDPARLAFVEHHLAHAASAYAMSGFREGLVVTLDGQGDGWSTTVWAGQQGKLLRLLDIPDGESLGLLYFHTLGYLGYGLFDEYKVMGLAPCGDPMRFRAIFDAICVLLPQGRWTIRWEDLKGLRDVLRAPRRAWEPIEQAHRDVAAALQEAIERATLHLLQHYNRETGFRQLCLAGGVAQNSTMVGRIARSGLFDRLFAQPAAHDAGCALGAAIVVHQELAGDTNIEPCTHAYWGLNLDDGGPVGAKLEAWSDVVQIRRSPAVEREAARLLAADAVIGWVQGRSEFGPRALGNRSILADPRHAANTARINELVKAREGYRPFAPAVLEEYAHEMFDMPPGTCAAFMTLTVPVHKEMRARLAAVTHVDGTARVQTVSKTTNERFWRLLHAFHDETGVPALLNTSFNHSIEPIVDSIDDAVTCFLTTGLSHLVVDDYIVTRRQDTERRIAALVPALPEYVRLTSARQAEMDGTYTDVHECEHTVTPTASREVSVALFELLRRTDGLRPVKELLQQTPTIAETEPLRLELFQLWKRRLIRLLPVNRPQPIGESTGVIVGSAP